VIVPTSAQAITVSGTAAPTDTTAGAHSNVNIHMNFSGGQVKDLTVGLPPGLIGDPNATPLCTVAQLNADDCPDITRVGRVTANATVTVVVLPVTVDVSGDLYNLTPQPGEPARFGIVLRRAHHQFRRRSLLGLHCQRNRELHDHGVREPRLLALVHGRGRRPGTDHQRSPDHRQHRDPAELRRGGPPQGRRQGAARP